jgi:hypothetical protein
VRVIPDVERLPTLEITLTPALSRITGRGGRRFIGHNRAARFVRGSFEFCNGAQGRFFATISVMILRQWPSRPPADL